MSRPFVPFSRAPIRPEFLRQMPRGWVLATPDQLDYANGFACAVGLVVVVVMLVAGVFW